MTGSPRWIASALGALALGCAPGERAPAPPVIEFPGVPGSAAPNLARAPDGSRSSAGKVSLLNVA